MSRRKVTGQRRGKKRRSGTRLFFTAIVVGAIAVGGMVWRAERKAEKAVQNIQQRENIDEAVGNTGNPAESADWNLTLVNSSNPVPENWEVELVEVEGGERVDKRIYDPLMKMLNDAREANQGQLPAVVSGYRTSEKQQSLYEEKIKKYRGEGYSEKKAKELAAQWVALPGYSEHQLGIAVDINGAVYDLYLWLQENSYRYGFIFRYPGEKTEITGTAEEVWHYRYVGEEAAHRMYEQGVCLEEYIEGKKEN